MRQKQRFVVDSLGRRRVRTILDFDYTSKLAYVVWVYTAPSYDPVYHARKRGETVALCGLDITYCEPSTAYSAYDTPHVYCGMCHSMCLGEMVMNDLAD